MGAPKAGGGAVTEAMDLPTSPLLERVRRGVIGEGELMDGPFGPRRVTYADYTASGRSLDFVEDFIRDAVLPRYANTHTESSGTGLQTTRLREDARQVIRDAVGGTGDDLVIFCGSGATAAVNKLIGILELRIPQGLDERYRLAERIPAAQRPVVFIGPYEHHSNELPWRESIADVVVIGEDAGGHIDLADLERQLISYAGRPLRIGSFSAASNVTGILTDTRAVAALLHAHGALSFWDYAAAGPYVPIRVAASAPAADDHKDAVFLSPHKFPGGPQTPGVLVVRRGLVRNPVPTVPGGGTVVFVDPVGHRYLDDPVAREEGGTPAIVESIRAGLVFALKQAVGTDLIQAREEQLWRRVLARWEGNPRIDILGSHRAQRLAVISFRIRHGDGQFLHHNFVVALLNDLFGIQARGGCSCAGPYGHRLLAIGPARSHAFREEIGHGCEGIKPGWTRVNLNYFISAATAGYIADAVELIAAGGYRLLPSYRFDPHTGLWRYASGVPEPTLRLSAVSWAPGGQMTWPRRRGQAGEDVFAGYLDAARTLIGSCSRRVADGPTGLSPDFEALRWFPLPPASLPPQPAIQSTGGAGPGPARPAPPVQPAGPVP
jgi:selenocysteine lyase/cysteine desulfurase